MRRHVLLFGSLAGAVMVLMFFISGAVTGPEADFDKAEWLGYLSMIAALSMIFIGIRNYRDKEQKGQLTFGKAFKVGLYITLVASLIYVAGWMLNYHTMASDFVEKYTHWSIEKVQSGDLSLEEKEAKIVEMRAFAEMYKNPFVMIGMTFLEIFPVGALISLICAALLRRKQSASA